MGLFDDRDKLLKYLIKNSIEAKIHIGFKFYYVFTICSFT